MCVCVCVCVCWKAVRVVGLSGAGCRSVWEDADLGWRYVMEVEHVGGGFCGGEDEQRGSCLLSERSSSD